MTKGIQAAVEALVYEVPVSKEACFCTLFSVTQRPASVAEYALTNWRGKSAMSGQ